MVQIWVKIYCFEYSIQHKKFVDRDLQSNLTISLRLFVIISNQSETEIILLKSNMIVSVFFCLLYNFMKLYTK